MDTESKKELKYKETELDFITVKEYKEIGGELEPDMTLYAYGEAGSAYYKTGTLGEELDDMVLIKSSTRQFRLYSDLVYVRVEVERRIVAIIN